MHRMESEKQRPPTRTYSRAPLFARQSLNGGERPSRCVVEDYTRDAAVLGAQAGGSGAVTLVSVRDADKLK